MSNTRALAQRCIFEAAALAGVERYDDCQAVLRSRRHPQALHAAVDITFDGRVCQATVRSVVEGKELPEKKVTNRVLGAAVRKGLFFYPASGMAGKAGGDAMMITPPFIIGDAEIEFIIRTARAALDEIQPNL